MNLNVNSRKKNLLNKDAHETNRKKSQKLLVSSSIRATHYMSIYPYLVLQMRKLIRFNWTFIDQANCAQRHLFHKWIGSISQPIEFLLLSIIFSHTPSTFLAEISCENVDTLTHAKNVIVIWFCHLFLSISRAIQPAVMTDHKTELFLMI